MIGVLRDEAAIFRVVVEERELTNVNDMTSQLVKIIKYQIKKGVARYDIFVSNLRVYIYVQ